MGDVVFSGTGPGSRIHLIRWHEGRDGWYPEVQAGRVIDRFDGEWILDVDGVECRYRESEWSRGSRSRAGSRCTDGLPPPPARGNRMATLPEN